MEHVLIALTLLLPTALFPQGELLSVATQCGYEFELPEWLQVEETGSGRSFGGTLPAIDGIENAIMVTCFAKTEFPSFQAFQDIYLTGNKFG